MKALIEHESTKALAEYQGAEDVKSLVKYEGAHP